SKTSPWEYQHSSFTPIVLNYLGPQGHIVDVGCGSGRNAFYLAQMGFKITAFDPSEVAIRKAKAQNTTVSFVVGNAESIRLEDACADGVLCAWVLSFCSDADSCIKEMQRITKSGGYIFLATHLDLTTEQGVRTEYVNEDGLLNSFLGWSVLHKQRYVEHMSAGADPHEGIHSHNSLKLVLRKPK
ncbi:MAG TPA: class I SAM-dependent methyltransferase, partial [Candidatus Nanoarchaeia archaeon]|nr:class I SAM-dependent methyltransferase [Candidatus Nanoarchaeia archaeon]